MSGSIISEIERLETRKKELLRLAALQQEVAELELKTHSHAAVADDLARASGLVCNAFHITQDALFGRRRTDDMKWPRHVWCYLVRLHTRLPLDKMGVCLGGRHHTTIWNSCKAVQNRMDTDHNFKAQVDAINSRWDERKAA